MGETQNEEDIKREIDCVRKQYGEEHPEYVDALNRLLVFYLENDKQVEAEHLFYCCLRIIKTIWGQESAIYVNTLNNLGLFYYEQFDLEKAWETFDEALDLMDCNPEVSSKDHGICCCNMALLYQSAEEYEQAEYCFNKAVNIIQGTQPQYSDELVIVINFFLEFYYFREKFDKAETLLWKKVSLIKDKFGEGSIDQAVVFNEIGANYYRMKNYRYAEIFIEQALDIILMEEENGRRSLLYGRALYNLGRLKSELGFVEKALKMYEEALEILEENLGNNHPDCLPVLNNTALIYKDKGKNFEKALSLFIRALNIIESNFDESHHEYATILNNIAVIYMEMGNLSMANNYLNKTLAVNTKSEEKHKYNESYLVNQATLSLMKGNIEEAKKKYFEALDVIRETSGEDSSDYLSCLSNIAVIYIQTGIYKEAQKILDSLQKKVPIVFGHESHEFATISCNIANMYVQMGLLEEAEEQQIKALSIFFKSKKLNHPDYARGLNNLGCIYLYRKKINEAGSTFKAALDIFEANNDKKHTDYITCIHNLGNIYYTTGSYYEAEKYFKKTDEVYTEIFGNNYYHLSMVKENLCDLNIIKGDFKQAISYMEKALEIDNKFIARNLPSLPESQQLIFLNRYKIKLAKSLTYSIKYFSSIPEAVNSTYHSIIIRKGISAETTILQSKIAMEANTPEMKKKAEHLLAYRKIIAEKLISGPGMEGTERFNSILEAWENQKNLIEKQLSLQIPYIEMGDRLLNINIETIASAVPKDTILIDYVCYRETVFDQFRYDKDYHFGRERYAAFVLPSCQPQSLKFFDIGDAEDIDHLVNETRKMIIEGKEGQMKEIGAKLYEIILEPLLSIFQEKNIILSTDGELVKLPFEILPLKNDEYLIDRYIVSYVNTARDLLRSKYTNKSDVNKPIVVADPDFDYGINDKNYNQASKENHDKDASRGISKAGLRFPRLPYTRLEGIKLAMLLGIEPILDSKVLKNRLLEVKSPQILHIATHGFFLENSPFENSLLKSGFAMSGAQSSINQGMAYEGLDNGIITAEEVACMELDGTELVVLSACETGLGDIKNGEGVFGLRRAFILAGAKTLIMSLWKVSDLSTAILMEKFYHNLLIENKDYFKAFRDAQLYLREITIEDIRANWLNEDWLNEIQEENEKEYLRSMLRKPRKFKPFNSPYYWGAFICQR